MFREYVTKRSKIQSAIFIALATILFIFSANLQARSQFVFEASGSPDQANEAIQAVLDEIDPEGHRSRDRTEGFAFYYKSTFFSPFNYGLMIGSISRQIPNTIVRIEGRPGDVQVFQRIMELEGIYDPDEGISEGQALSQKNHFYGQGLNLLMPPAAIFYSAYQSPTLTTGQAWKRTLWYFMIDLALVYVAGTNFFQESFDASKNGGGIAAALALTRTVNAYQTANLNRGHNRLYKLEYTFPLN